jgi:hypothetical protein
VALNPRVRARHRLDFIGGETDVRSLPTLRDGGLLISVPSSADVEPLREAAQDRVCVTGILVEPERTGMEAIAALVEDGGPGPRSQDLALRPAPPNQAGHAA